MTEGEEEGREDDAFHIKIDAIWIP